MRRAVLGDDYVDLALANTTDFTKPLQKMVTENCWGEIWTRKGLPRKTRSLITIATLAALKAPEELKGHVLARCATAARLKKFRKCCCSRQYIAVFLQA